MNTVDPDKLRFEYKLKNQPRVYTIPFNQIIDIEYGQKAGRRVGASIATAILLTPLEGVINFNVSYAMVYSFPQSALLVVGCPYGTKGLSK